MSEQAAPKFTDRPSYEEARDELVEIVILAVGCVQVSVTVLIGVKIAKHMLDKLHEELIRVRVRRGEVADCDVEICHFVVSGDH